MDLDNVINTLYLTFSHNEYAIAFFVGIILSIINLLITPNRKSVILLIAFSTLFIGFEYEKHIMQPLMDQTLSSLGLEGRSGRSASWLIGIFQKLLPFGFFSLGWGLLFSVIFFDKELLSKIFKRRSD